MLLKTRQKKRVVGNFEGAIYELVKKAATELPGDIVEALEEGRSREDKMGNAYGSLDTILENVSLAKEKRLPICQDTGMIFFEVYHPMGYSTIEMRGKICEAIRQVTRDNYLRPNSVDILTGKNTGDNIGKGSPLIYFHEREEEGFEIWLLLKGGGCENVGVQYKLPDVGLKAGRDLEGVKRCVLEGVYKAQGLGCAPGILGVGVGGDRAGSHYLAKRQLFRKLWDRSEEEEIRELEEEILSLSNGLGIGPMGFGGRTTLLGAKVGFYHRHPATYYVTISYMCWASRRKVMRLSEQGEYEIED